MRDVHRRLAYAIDVQMMIVKLFIRDLQQRSKVRTGTNVNGGVLGGVVFDFNNNCKRSSSLLSCTY